MPYTPRRLPNSLAILPFLQLATITIDFSHHAFGGKCSVLSLESVLFTISVHIPGHYQFSHFLHVSFLFGISFSLGIITIIGGTIVT